MSIYEIIPDHEALLALEPEEIAGIILEHLNSLPEMAKHHISRHSFGLPHTVKNYPETYWAQISEALMEGWIWLEREGLIAPKPGEKDSSVFITRRGKKIKNREGLESYKKGNLLPRHLLHPQIAQKVWSAFIRGEYETAIFQSFKEVEVAVRKKGNYKDIDIGVPLMRKAFHKTNGPLTDTSKPEAEREALQHLFAGAIGSYKNPHSHRSVSITEPTEAVEMIILASHLLNIVDAREIEKNSGSSPE